MTEQSDKPEQPKKKGKKLLIVVPALLMLIGGGVGAGFYTGKIGGAAKAAEPAGPKLIPKSEQKRGGSGDAGAGGEAKAKTGSTPPSGTGGDRYASNYYALDKDFTANLQDSAHFLQVGIAVSTPYDDSVIENLKTNDIAVRSAVLMTLGDTTEDEVFTAEGKHQLQIRLTKAINDTLKQKEGFGGISNTYFTSFVVQ